MVSKRRKVSLHSVANEMTHCTLLIVATVLRLIYVIYPSL